MNINMNLKKKRFFLVCVCVLCFTIQVWMLLKSNTVAVTVNEHDDVL